MIRAFRRALALILPVVLATPHTAAAQPAAAVSWMRYPAISPDGQTIAFTYKGDLYRVPTAGGAAIAITSHVAHDYMPVWSNDSRRIAFAADRYGNFDIFVVGATGGEPTRLTYHSANEYPYAFTADDRNILFGSTRMDAATNRQYPTGSLPELYQVPTAGGRPIQLLTTPAENVALSRNGQLLLYEDRKGGENAWRKHHNSAIARDIWVYDSRAGSHRQVTTFDGEDRNPVFTDSDRALFYLSEESGTFNVHKVALEGGKSQQLTRFNGPPVRFLSKSTDGTLSFGHDGLIYTLKEGAQPRLVPIAIAADARGNNERVLSVTGGARDLAVAPSGKEIAFVFRGDVFVSSVEGGITKRITNTPDGEVGVQFSPDGKSLVYASERGGRWAIYQSQRRRGAEPYFYASTVVDETPLLANDRQNYQPKFSPDGKELAFIEDRNVLRVMNLATKQVRTLLTDRELFSNNPNHHFEWSPDGKWMLFDLSVPGIAPGEVGLISTDGRGTVHNLTESGFNDGGGQWILGGKAMLWFSNRDGLKAVAQTGGTQQDAYAMFFDRDAFDRFQLSKADVALVKEAEDRDKPKVDSAKTPSPTPVAPLTLDLEDLEFRKSRLTLHSSSLGDALLSKDGETLYYLARFEKGMNLWSTSLRSKETKMIVQMNANGGSMQWDKEQKNIFLLADGGISRIDPATAKRDVVSLSGELAFDQQAEREAMFDHVWRKTRDTFYTQGYHGVEWSTMRPQYARYLPHIGNSHEFSEMLAEMLGELNVSHSGSSFSGTPQPGADATASLGAFFDLTRTAPGVRIDEVIKGGPLDRGSIAVKPGAIIEAVDGVSIGPDRDIAELLNRKAEKNVLLTLDEGGTKREIVVRPIAPADENRLLYRRWVQRNAEEVDRLSQGKLGYVHIPGMNDGAYRTTFEEVMGKYATRQGVVIDTRNNGGGDLVADLAMFLSGKKFFDYTTDTRSSGYEPNFRWTKPTVALANEANYSDGHCFAYAYKEQQIGKLIGMPVPGTCTFAGWESLQDGIRWGVPGLGVKDAVTGKYLENLQTEPDIVVRNEYSVVAKGRDQQLEAAVKSLLEALQVLK